MQTLKERLWCSTTRSPSTFESLLPKCISLLLGVMEVKKPLLLIKMFHLESTLWTPQLSFHQTPPLLVGPSTQTQACTSPENTNMFQNAPNQTTTNNHKNHQQITFPCWWYSPIASRMNEIKDSPSPKLVACFSANSRTPYQSWSVLISWFSTQKRCNTNRGWTSATHHCWEIWLKLVRNTTFPGIHFFNEGKVIEKPLPAPLRCTCGPQNPLTT